MKKLNPSYQGGGANSLKNTKSVFKPLIASSLALALGMSVAVATEPTIQYGTSTAQSDASLSDLSWVSADNFFTPQTASKNIDNLIFQFQKGDTPVTPSGVSNTDSSTIYTITYQSGAEKQDYINNDPQNPIAPSNSIGSSMSFDAKGNAIKLNDGGGKITIDFGDYTTEQKRKFSMKFDGGAIDSSSSVSPNTEKYSLIGNIDIYSGDEAIFDISFKNSMKGNIQIYTNSFRYWDEYISGTNGAINFADNANLDGSITSLVNNSDANTAKGGFSITFGETSTSTNTVTENISFVNGQNTILFKGNGKIEGILNAGWAGFVEGAHNNADGSPHYVDIFATNNVVFCGEGDVATIQSSAGINNVEFQNTGLVGTIKNTAGTNNIEFKQSGSIGTLLVQKQGQAFNNVTSNNDLTVNQTIEANGLIPVNTGATYGENNLTINGKLTIGTEASGRDGVIMAYANAINNITAESIEIQKAIKDNSNAVRAGIWANSYGENHIVITQGGASSITAIAGNIEAGGEGINTITFNEENILDIKDATGQTSSAGSVLTSSGGSNKIIFQKKGAIQGTLQTTGGNAQFDFYGLGTLQAINTGGGKSTVNFYQGGSFTSLTSSNGETYLNYGVKDINFGSSTFSLSGGTTTIGFTDTLSNIHNKTITLDTSKISFTNGALKLVGMKSVTLGSNANTLDTKSGNLNLVYDNLGVSQNQVIFVGNITTAGQLTFSLDPSQDTTATPDGGGLHLARGAKTLLVDGNITIENGGGLSAFYNSKTNKFEGILGTTNGHQITFQSALTGTFNFWLTGATSFTSMNLTNSHIVLDGSSSISGDLTFTSGTNEIVFQGSNSFVSSTGNINVSGGKNFLYMQTSTTQATTINFNRNLVISGGELNLILIDQNRNNIAGTNNPTTTINFGSNVKLGGGGLFYDPISEKFQAKVSNLSFQESDLHGLKAYITGDSSGALDFHTDFGKNQDGTTASWRWSLQGNTKLILNGSTSNAIAIGGLLSTNGNKFDVYVGDPLKDPTNGGIISSNATTSFNANIRARTGNGKIVFATNGDTTLTSSNEVIYSGNFGSTPNVELDIDFYGNGNNKIQAKDKSTIAIHARKDGNNNTTNNITFHNGNGTIFGTINTSYQTNGGTGKGYNNITFANTTQTNLIEGDSFSTDASGVNTFYFGGQVSNTIRGNISNNGVGNFTFAGNGNNTIEGTIGGNGQNNISFGSDQTELKLQGATNTITTLTAFESSNRGNILTLDTTTASMSANINKIVNGAKLTIKMTGDDTKSSTLTLNNADNTNSTIKELILTSNTSSGDKNIFTLNHNSTTTILNKLDVGSGKNLKIDFNGDATLELNNSILTAGTTSINVADTKNATIMGNIDTATGGNTNITFAGTGSLTLKGSENQLNTLTSTTSGTLNLDASSSNVNAVIANVADDKLGVKFTGGQNALLKIKSTTSGTPTTLSLRSIELANHSINNTLDLSELADSVTNINLASAITVGSTVDNGGIDSEEGLSIKVKGLSSGARNVTFAGGLDTVNGTSTLTILDGDATLTAGASKTINLTNLNISANNTSSTVTFEATTTIGTLTADSGSNLVVGKASVNTSLTIGTTNSTLNSVELKGDTAVLEINGGKQTINTLTTSATTANNLTFADNNLTIGAIDNSTTKTINLTLENSTLTLGKTTAIKKLEVINKGQSTINLSSPLGKTTRESRNASGRKTLTIGSSGDSGAFSGNLNAIVFASKNEADKIIVDGTNSSGSITISAMGDIDEILSITKDNGVFVAEIKNSKTNNGGGTNDIVVQGGISEIDGVILDLVVEEEKDNSNPQNGTGRYYIGKTISQGVDTSIQAVASSALTVNYDLFLANFNSLNKRMGELRDNPHSQGVWARVFGGAMSNDFGSGSKSEYVTAQAGYDYSLTLGNANNYMGIAIAYGKSWTKANEGVGLSSASLSNVNSDMVEVGIYNSYVMDSGWYNDTIFKFDYIMSDFTLKTSKNTSENNTNNFAMVLSDEFGYRYKFAESEKGNWYIDPQVEVAFGYFNQSDFNHALNSSGNVVMNVTQDSIFNLRTRAGMSLGKKFNTTKGFATLYVGAFYEYDYIEGGNAKVQVTGVNNPLDNLESNGRAIVNIGSNIELTEGVRMYIDVEKSFGDKQRTDMQFNFGARYSFGEKTPTISYQEQQKKRVAPLKVEDKQEVSNTQEAPANTQATSKQEAKN